MINAVKSLRAGRMFRTLAAGLLMSAALSMPAGAQDQIVLKATHLFPNALYIWKEGPQVLIDHVEKATNGKVKVEVYPSGQLGKDTLSALESGLADIALLIPSYTSDRLPLSSAAEMPGLFSTSCEGTEKYWPVAKPGGILDKAEYAPRAVRVLMVNVQVPYMITTTRKPPEGMDALKGLKLRAVGSSMQKTVGQLGAVPVQISAPELFDALSRGTVDGALYNYTGMPDYQLEKQFKFSAEGPRLGTTLLTLGMREETWQKLPDDVKAAFEEGALVAQKNACEWQDKNNTDIRDRIVASEGHTVVKLSPEEVARWEAAVAGVADTWVSELSAAGKDGKVILDALRAQ